MWEVILLTGLMMMAASLYLLVRIEHLKGMIDTVLASRWIYLAALLRLMLGAALIASAHTVMYSLAVTVLGWLIAFSGLVLVAIPQSAWVDFGGVLAELPRAVLRLFAMIWLLIGGFLLYVSLV